MPILDPQEGEIFTLRTFKAFEGYRWANSYEFQCVDGSATYADLTNVALAVCARERGPLANSMRIYKATVSTYQPDSRPYDPSKFVTINLNMTGEANFTADTLPLSICVFVRRNVLTGRSGKAFYRGFLSEQNVLWGGDRFEISAQRQTEISNVLNSMLAAIRPLFQFVLARGTPQPVDVRNVIGMTVVSRTTMKKMDNRYFDISDR